MSEVAESGIVAGNESPASDPSTAVNNAPAQTQGSSSADTAPAAEYREALERLSKGETPQAINADLRSRNQGSARAESNTAPASEASPEPSQPGQANEEGHGLDEKELNALRRAKFDMSVLKHMPASNRKAVARGLMASQAETDRQYQQKMAEARGAGGQQNTQAEPTTPNEQTNQSEANAEDSAGKEQRKADDQQASQASAAQPSFTMSDDEYRTLVDTYGEDFAKFTKQREERLVHGLQKQYEPFMNIALNLASHFERTEFDKAITSLKAQPGFDKITDDDVQAIRKKADLLIRAADDPRSYRYEEAVSDAAASLFKQNSQQAAQARLAQARKTSLNGSPDRGRITGNDAGRPMNETQRMHAILANMKAGMSPQQAAEAVDAA